MMKNRKMDFTSNIVLEGNFNVLSCGDMYAIRGGASTEPPLPSTGGDDFPIDIRPKSLITTTTTTLFTATSSTTIIEIDSDPKEKEKKKKRF